MWRPTKSAHNKAVLLSILDSHEAGQQAGQNGSEEGESALAKPPSITMIYSMLTDCHAQLVLISRAVWLLVALAAVGLWRLFV